MRKLIFIFIFLFSLSLVAQESSMSVLQKKPYFELRIDTQGVEVHVSINGIDVFSEYFGNSVQTQIPINHWLAPDKNVFDIAFRSVNSDGIYSENLKVKVDVLVSNDGAGKRYKVFEIVLNSDLINGKILPNISMPRQVLNSVQDFRADSNGDVIVEAGKLEISKNVSELSTLTRSSTFSANIPRWAFFDSDPVPDVYSMPDAEYEKYQQDLLKEYLKIFQAIKTNNIKSVISMFDERNKELDAAFFYEPGTMEKKILAALVDAASDKDAELLDLESRYVGFYMFDDNKLTKLVREDLSPAIVQNFKKAQGSQSFDLIFRYKNGKWILTR